MFPLEDKEWCLINGIDPVLGILYRLMSVKLYIQLLEDVIIFHCSSARFTVAKNENQRCIKLKRAHLQNIGNSRLSGAD
jgi:hypothetical protein